MYPEGHVKNQRIRNRQHVRTLNSQKKTANSFEQAMLFQQALKKEVMCDNESENERLNEIVNQFDPNDVETERFRMQKILKSIAKLGSVKWEELHKDVMKSCTIEEILRHFDGFSVTNLMEFAKKRKFIFFNFDKQRSPEVRDYTYFLIISSMFRYCCLKNEKITVSLLTKKFSKLSDCDAMEDVPESFVQIIDSNRELFQFETCDRYYVDENGEVFENNLNGENESEHEESSDDDEEASKKRRERKKYITQLTPIIGRNVIAFFFDEIVIDLTRSDDRKLNVEGKSRIETVQGVVNSCIGDNVKIMSNMEVHSDFGYVFVNSRTISKHVGNSKDIVEDKMYMEGYRCNDPLKKLKWMGADSFFVKAKINDDIELDWKKEGGK